MNGAKSKQTRWLTSLQMMTDLPLPPGRTIGILGGGQLGRMLAIAAAQLGLRVHIYCPQSDAPAFDVSAFKTVAGYDDMTALRKFAQSVDVVTIEFENIPAETLAEISKYSEIAPDANTLAIIQDRLMEKNMLRESGIDVTPYEPVSSRDELKLALNKIGMPAILKTRRFGYDGKGQQKIDLKSDPDEIYNKFQSQPLILEAFVPFDIEFSVVLVRNRDGEILEYTPSENIHKNHILSRTIVPANLPDATLEKARSIARQIGSELKFVGVLAVEMFYQKSSGLNQILVNEIAPRVHNSGHWTIDACTVSQFENHIRAVAGWPLGSTVRHSDAEMINLLGSDIEAWHRIANNKTVALHIYGKERAAAGRKMGHATRLFPRKDGSSRFYPER